MEPEDRVLEMKRLETIADRKKGDVSDQTIKEIKDEVRDVSEKMILEDFTPTDKGHASGGRVPLFKGKIIKGIGSLIKKKKPKPKIPQKVEGKIWKTSEGETQVIGMGDMAHSEEMNTAVVKGMALSDAMKKMALDPSSLSDYNKFNELVEAGMKGFDPAIRQQIIRAKYGDVVGKELLENMIANADDSQRLATVMGTIDEGMAMHQKGMHPDEIIETIKESWKRKPQAEGGRVPLMYGGDPGFAFEYGGSWADWHDQHRNTMPVEQYIQTKLPKARLPFREMQSGGLAYMLGEPTYMKYGVGGSVGHAPWHKPTGQAQPTPHMDTPTPNVATRPDPLKAPRGLPSVAPKNMDPAYMQQQMMQQAMMGRGNTGQGPRPMAKEGGIMRMGFKKGGDMSRRGFMKLIAGLAALPVVGKYFKLAKPAAKVAETFTHVPIKDIPGMPVWFKPLVAKVIKEGTDVTKKYAVKDMEVVHHAKLPGSGTDVIVTQQLDTGDVLVDIGLGKHGWSAGRYGQPARLEYKAAEDIMTGPSDEPFKSGMKRDPFLKIKTEVHEDLVGSGLKGDPKSLHLKPGKTKEEFFVDEAEFTGGHPENVKFEESVAEKYGDHASDFTEVEKYATGKNIDKKIIGKKAARDDWAEGRAMEQAEDVDFAKGGLAYLLGE
jgi:hypothetical protein